MYSGSCATPSSRWASAPDRHCRSRRSRRALASAVSRCGRPYIKLSEAGLLTIRPQRGTFIVKISMKQVFDARFVREAVELAVVRRACAEMTVSGMEVLRTNLDAQRKAATDLDPVRFMDLDEAFHRDIALGIGCEYAWRVVEGTKAQMDRVRYLSLPHATLVERLIGQHQAVVDAIAAHDADGAEAAMRQHLREILTSLPELAERFPEFFERDQAPDTNLT